LSSARASIRDFLAPAIAVGMSLIAGCFSYVPVTTGAAPTGTELRVELSSEGTTMLSQTLGARVIAVDGQLASASGDNAMVIAPQWVQTTDGLRERWTGAPTFAFPRTYFTTVERRALDRRRTTFAVIAIGASIATIGTAVMRGGGSESGRDPGTGTGVFRR
jgi:hypothetical protein